jgi:hypothetical protein
MEQYIETQGMYSNILNDRQLTAAVKNATTPERLAQLAAAHTGTLNPIHIAAILTKLANITKKGPNQVQPNSSSTTQPINMYILRAQQSRQQLLGQLMGTLKKQQCLGHCPRGLANIVWALAKLHAAPDGELLSMLLSGFFQQLSVAVPQDVANILWGCAQLTRDHGLGNLQQRKAVAESSMDGLADYASEPSSSSAAAPAGPVASSTSSSSRAAGGTAGRTDAGGTRPGSSSSTAGGAQSAAADSTADSDVDDDELGLGMVRPEQQLILPDGQPLLTAAQVQKLLQQLCTMLPLAASQTISNIAWAVTVLQQCHEWCLCACIPHVQQLVCAFSTHLHDAQPGHVQRVVRCITQLSTACAEHNALAWIEWQPPPLALLLHHLTTQRRLLKQYHVASVLKDVALVASLFMPFDEAARAEAAGLGPVAAQASLAAAAAAAAAATAAAASELAGTESEQQEEEDEDAPQVRCC